MNFWISLFVTHEDFLVRSNMIKISHQELEERLLLYLVDSFESSVLIAQDTAERVKQAAQERSNNIISTSWPRSRQPIEANARKQTKRQNTTWKKEWLLRQKVEE